MKGYKKIQVIMPMAGRGSRFANSGILTPKPLIKYKGLPLFQKAFSSLDEITCEKIVYAIVLEEHCELFEIEKEVKGLSKNVFIHKLNKCTRGSLETALAIKSYLDPSLPVIILDCDLWFYSKGYYSIINDEITENVDGLLVCFESRDARFSYAKVDSLGWVEQTAEKQVISNSAIIGSYFIRYAHQFVSVGETIVGEWEKNVSGEIYTSLIFDKMVRSGCKIKATMADFYESYGTPEEMNKDLGRHT